MRGVLCKHKSSTETHHIPLRKQLVERKINKRGETKRLEESGEREMAAQSRRSN